MIVQSVHSKTNYEKIKSMNIDEIANYIDHSDLICEICEVHCNSAYCGCRYYDTPKFIKQWLESEAVEN